MGKYFMITDLVTTRSNYGTRSEVLRSAANSLVTMVTKFVFIR